MNYKYPSVSIDSYDIVICVAMIGGFITEIWTPLIVSALIYAFAIGPKED